MPPIAGQQDRTPDVSVIISTFNRADGLRRTLDALVAQRPGTCPFEVLVVDNNSTDGTRAAIHAFIAEGHPEVRYLFEARQGVSHGRNAAIRAARASILAFTDDDVIVAPDWIDNICRALREHPEVDYVTGKMMPIFECEPPAWLTRPGNSGPCVLRDRGNERLFSRPGHFFPGWATANIAFRREVFDRIGLFSGEFPRGQDLELIVRLWQANGCGMYAPDVVVSHEIPTDRMTKAYHRMWHSREGDIRSRVRYSEVITADGKVLQAPPPGPTLFGVPAFLYRELAPEAARWIVALARRDDGAAFFHESKLRQRFNYIRTRLRQHAATRRRSRTRELITFARALVYRAGNPISRTGCRPSTSAPE